MSEQNEDRLEAQNRLVTEAAAATEAEQEAREAWHNLLMATVYRERGSLTDPKEPFALAVALSEGGSSLAEEVSPMVVDRAKAYVEAVAKCREAWAMLQAEVAYGHPEHLDELNRERSPEETLEMLGELRGKVDPPEGP